eukprot:SAG31_NODE_19324_length_606_cov_0.607495_1_plen_74_part_10
MPLLVLGVVLTVIGTLSAWVAKLRIAGDALLKFMQERALRVQFVSALKIIITFKQVMSIIFEVLVGRLTAVNPA